MPLSETALEKAPSSPIKRGFRVLARVGVGIVGISLILLASFYGYLRLTGNVHEVEAGVYYRSAQLAADELEVLIRQQGIRSVLNLRGKNTGTPWYDQEREAAAAAGATHLDYAISAGRPVTLTQIDEIQALIKAAPKPILVHCEQGADRTGLITAIYRLSRGDGLALAEEALSIRYGHFPYLFWRRTEAMDESFRLYLKERGALMPLAPDATGK